MPKWNLTNIYNPKFEQKLLSELKEKTEEFRKFRKKLNKNLSTKNFIEILKKNEKITELCSKLSIYKELKLCENTADPKANAEETKISQLCAEIGNQIIFFGLWFKKIPEKQAQKYIKNSGKYRYFLKRIRDFKKNTLKEKEEQIINLKNLSGTEAASKFYDIITNKFTFKFKNKEMTLEEINQFKQSSIRKERKEAYKIIFEKYKENHEILGEIYKTITNDWRNENIKIRNFKNPLNVRNKGNDISDEIVQKILSVIKEKIQIFQEYFRIKAKICGIKNFNRYDIYAPYKKTNEKYTYEESKKIVLETYKEFSKEAYVLAKKIFDEKHIHSEVQKNKRSGAFCCSVTKEITPYILLNHTEKINDLFTMMHEIGHGIHSLKAKDQTNFTFHSSLPLAETASIFGENILAKKMLKNCRKDEKISILIKLLDSQYASIARQAFFVMFEEKAHDIIEKGANTDELNKEYLKNLKEQFGKIKVDEIFQNEWKYIPHIYHSPFYCYAYSFGNLLVLALYKMFEEEGEKFIPKYMKILSYGGSESPENILNEVGIDITKKNFWEKGFEIIQEEIEELKRLAE
jgi:oligoendopeptidase F